MVLAFLNTRQYVWNRCGHYLSDDSTSRLSTSYNRLSLNRPWLLYWAGTWDTLVVCHHLLTRGSAHLVVQACACCSPFYNCLIYLWVVKSAVLHIGGGGTRHRYGYGSGLWMPRRCHIFNGQCTGRKFVISIDSSSTGPIRSGVTGGTTARSTSRGTTPGHLPCLDGFTDSITGD